jgi:hypothetical protein
MNYADAACRFTEDSNNYIVVGECLSCKKSVMVHIPKPHLYKYRQGAHIQDAMPTLTPGDREFLISGVCEPCFDEMWVEDDE